MNLINENEASFLTNLSEKDEYLLQVPTPFAKKYLEKINNNSEEQPKIVLKTTSGVSREVKCFKIKDEHYFINGWPEFVKDNNLQNGDSLIFFLIKSSSQNLIFEVLLYAQNGCSKNTTSPVIYTVSDSAGSSDEKKHSIDREEASDDDDHSSKNVESSLISLRRLTKVVKKTYLKQMLLNRRFLEVAGIGDYLYLQLENEEGKKWEVDLKKRGWDGFPYIGGGWSNFVKDNKVKVGNSCDFYHVKNNVLRVRVYKTRDGRSSEKPRPSRIEVD